MDELISRQAALVAVKDALMAWSYMPKWRDEKILEAIAELPSAQHEPKRGKWIEHEHGYWTFVNADGERDGWIPDYECDQCGSRGWKWVAPMNFCPNCGADMRGD